MTDAQPQVLHSTTRMAALTVAPAEHDAEDAKPVRDHWAERCMYEVMKLESTTSERLEQLEKSLMMQIQDALMKQHELEERLQPSGSASERYRAAAAAEIESGDGECQRLSRGSPEGAMQAIEASAQAQDNLMHMVEASLQEMRSELALQREQREVEAELVRRELRTEQSTALQEQAQLIEATKIGLSMDLKQGFDRLRTDLGMVDQHGGMSTIERVDNLEAHFFNDGQRAESCEKQILELQQQRAHIDETLIELHTRLEAAERAAFEIEEPLSLVKRLAVLEASSQPLANTVAFSESQISAMHPLLTRLDNRLEQMESIMARSAASGHDASTFQMPASVDTHSLKVAIEKAQRDVQHLADDLAKEREERQAALSERTCVVAKAAASTIERMEQRFVERMGELSNVGGFANAESESHHRGLNFINGAVPGEAPTVRPSPHASPAPSDRGLVLLEERVNANNGELTRLATMSQLHGQRIEVIDHATKDAIARLSEKYQAACELGTRTLLLEKAVKWLLEVGMRTDRAPGDLVYRRTSDPTMAAGRPGPGSMSPQSPLKVSRVVTSAVTPRTNNVCRSYSQPLFSARSTDGVMTQGLMKFVHRTLSDTNSIDTASIVQPRRNDSPEVAVAASTGQPFRWTARSASPPPPVHASSPVPAQASSPITPAAAQASSPVPSYTKSTERLSGVPTVLLSAASCPSTEKTSQSLPSASSPRGVAVNAASPRQPNLVRQCPAVRVPSPWRLTDLSRAASGRGLSKSAEPPVDRSSQSPRPGSVSYASREKSPTAISPRGAYHWVLPHKSGGLQQDMAASRGRPFSRHTPTVAQQSRTPVKATARWGATK